MRQGLQDDFDENRVAAISRDVAQAIDAATFGSGSWDEVPLALSRAFPGSFGILYNMNFPEKRLNFLSVQNTDAAFATSLAEHFAYINPWAPYWTSVKSTFIAASEEVFPARTFAKSEFYNDWLLPQNKAEAVRPRAASRAIPPRRRARPSSSPSRLWCCPAPTASNAASGSA